MSEETSKALSARTIETVHHALKNSLKNLCGQEPRLRATDRHPAGGTGKCGVIGFQGDLEFRLVVGLDQAASEKLARRFTGVPIQFDCEAMGDVVSELVNVIAGDVVAELDSKRVAVRMTLPQVSGSLEVQAVDPAARIVDSFVVSTADGDCRCSLLVGSHSAGPAAGADR